MCFQQIVIQNGEGHGSAKDITTTTNNTNNHENGDVDGGSVVDNNGDGVEKGALDSLSNKSHHSDNNSLVDSSEDNEASALNKISSNHR